MREDVVFLFVGEPSVWLDERYHRGRAPPSVLCRRHRRRKFLIYILSTLN